MGGRNRGRRDGGSAAVFLPATTRRYDYPYIRSLEFLVRCPPEIAWHILGYWRCQYPVDTQFIDELGVH